MRNNVHNFFNNNKFLKQVFILFLIIAALEFSSWIFLVTFERLTKKIGKQEALVSYWEYDPYLMWVPKQDVRGYDKYSSFQMNNYGFRNSYDISLNKKPNSYRIIAIGGSATWGSGATSNKTVWTQALEEILKKDASCDFEVLNAGCAGYTSFQELTYLNFKLLDFSPDQVIIMNGYNDVFIGSMYPENKFTSNVSPYYVGLKKFFKEALFVQILDLIREKSNFKALVKRAQEKIRYERGESLVGKLYLNPKAVEVYLNNLKSMADILKGRQIKSTVVLQPYMGLSKKKFSPEEKLMLEKNKQMDQYLVGSMEILRTRLGEFCLKNNIEFLDMSSAFDNLSPDQTVWFDHVHLNDLGNKILAQKLSQVILKNSFVEK